MTRKQLLAYGRSSETVVRESGQPLVTANYQVYSMWRSKEVLP
jgi:hypothetical protein